LALKSRGDDGLLIAIDPWDASGDAESVALYDLAASEIGLPLHEAFRDNLAAVGALGYVTTIPLRSYDARRAHGWEPASLDGLYIDGDHTCAAVRQDLADWA